MEALPVRSVAFFEDRDQQFFLAGKVVQQPGRGESGCCRDSRQRRARLSIDCVGPQGRADQAITGGHSPCRSGPANRIGHQRPPLTYLPIGWLVYGAIKGPSLALPADPVR